jgi:hypothetical protein
MGLAYVRLEWKFYSSQPRLMKVACRVDVTKAGGNPTLLEMRIAAGAEESGHGCREFLDLEVLRRLDPAKSVQAMQAWTAQQLICLSDVSLVGLRCRAVTQVLPEHAGPGMAYRDGVLDSMWLRTRTTAEPHHGEA